LRLPQSFSLLGTLLSVACVFVCLFVCLFFLLQLEYAALDAAILLVAFNQMAHDYHINPVSVTSQSHKRRLAQTALSSPPQRSFRHYIEVSAWSPRAVSFCTRVVDEISLLRC
jgi:hypothetical protein